MEKLTFEFDDDEMRLIEDYKQEVGAVDIRVAILNAVSVAIDRIVWDNAFMKRGHWVVKYAPGTHWYQVTCSHCGEDVTSSIPLIGFFPNVRPMWDYCPECGAMMDNVESNT